jgi:ABC-type lipoprotein release transport system permease subunit
MFYFQTYGSQGCWFGLLFGLGMILLAFTTWYSIRTYRKPLGPDGQVDEHAEPGIPLVLKIMYLGVLIWLVIVTYLVATTGSGI